jgi:hypothetical protein
LNEQNSVAMMGTDQRAIERWADISGKYYASGFIAQFSYKNKGPGGAEVRVCVEPEAETLRGRLEARRLKPNFAYQIKLRGLFADRRSFEAIGHAGRWRLPGRETNYCDEDYEAYEHKDMVEAYILFDYFVTDKHGNAVRDFALDSNLHVLWNAGRQRADMREEDLLGVWVDSSDPAVYARPRAKPTAEFVWAEREVWRYRTPEQTRFLPPGHYRAELALTEESFHSRDGDGGWWCTPYHCPIAFTVKEPQ